ncbi:MAG TPA: hypothetical protein VJV77_02370 [Casimicrobiaceae bacterium]|nr:hypothetical protein [Casimicrobiaceae bacterium]
MDDKAYLARKHREIELIAGCFAAPVDATVPRSAADAIDEKFRLAGALRAERSLSSWAITETARPEIQQWRVGAYAFSFGYQRADLEVRGPSIYDVPGRRSELRQYTLYTGSGMSAVAVVFTALLRVRKRVHLLASRGFYSETRELLESLGEQVALAITGSRSGKRGAASRSWPAESVSSTDVMRVLLVDSCVSTGFENYRDARPDDFDVVVLDTTCFWRTSARIRRVVAWASQAHLPLVLVRSHAKLDALGIEYGRLGSVVLLWQPANARAAWMRDFRKAVEDSSRLYGAAAIPAHFPPFTGTEAYERASRARTAAIVRCTRRMALHLALALGRDAVRRFQHGLYLALIPGRDMHIDDVKRAADDLYRTLARQGLLVKHAGSFGFDFVAVEWFYDAIARRNVIRVTGADLPFALVDRVADGIEAWWSRHRMSGTPSTRAHPAGPLQPVAP